MGLHENKYAAVWQMLINNAPQRSKVAEQDVLQQWHRHVLRPGTNYNDIRITSDRGEAAAPAGTTRQMETWGPVMQEAFATTKMFSCKEQTSATPAMHPV